MDIDAEVWDELKYANVRYAVYFYYTHDYDYFVKVLRELGFELKIEGDKK